MSFVLNTMFLALMVGAALFIIALVADIIWDWSDNDWGRP
jgi:hypothetical protein